MSLSQVLAATACMATAAAAVAAERPTDFAYQMSISCQLNAAQCRMTLPRQVYASVTRDDLGDVRVFNAAGEVVPYVIRAHRRLESGPRVSMALPLFALRGDVRAAAESLQVTIESHGSAMNLRTPNTAETHEPVHQYVIDGRAMTDPVVSLTFGWPAQAAEFSGRVQIEASNDFAIWRLVVASAPLANLRAIDRQFEQTRVAFPASRAQYWRVTWRNGAPDTELTSVEAQPGSTAAVERGSADFDGTSTVRDPNEIAFDLGARLPADSVDLLLPEVNSAVTAELLSRGGPHDPWHAVAQGEFYRVQSQGEEYRNVAVPLLGGADYDRYWLLRSHALNAPLDHRIKLRVTWIPAELDFLTRGSAPFVLAFGRTGATSAAMVLPTLPVEAVDVSATLGEQRVLGGSERIAEPTNGYAWKTPLLWTVLGSSVLLLAWMALRLSKELSDKPPQSR